MIIGAITPAIAIFMNLLNRTLITGRKNIAGFKGPWILASNHLTLLDDMFIGPILLFPEMLRGYKWIPYHAPEESNFYKKKLIAMFMKQVKSVPLVRGDGVFQEGMNKLIEAVKSGGILHIFPEGTRTRTGKIGEAKPGVGRIVYETRAPVIPIYHQGLEKVLPIGSGIPRIGNEIRIAIGEPMYFEDQLKQDSETRTWRAISRRIIEAIHEQQAIAEAKWGHKPIIIKNKH